MSKLLLILLALQFPSAAHAAPAPAPGEVSVGAGNFEGDVEEASLRIRQIMRNNRVNGQATRVVELINKREPEFAQKVLDQLQRDYPELKDDCAFRMDQSLIYFWRGDYQNAYAKIDGVIRQVEAAFPNGVKPGDTDESEAANIAEAYFTRSSIARKLGMPGRAVADIDKAFLLDPKPYMALNKCRALLKLGRHGEAAAALNTAYKMSAKTAESSDKGWMCREFSRHGLQPDACGAKLN